MKTNKDVRHVLGISGGKDSTALAIYMEDHFPDIDIEYYFCDTKKELDETYQTIEKLEDYLGKKVIRLEAAADSHLSSFDHFLALYGGYLPSSSQRWCTKKLKLQPFESFVGDDLVISYVGIRDDESREGYISKKSNIQSIFPFRQNIWSEDVIRKVFVNTNIDFIVAKYADYLSNEDYKNDLIQLASTELEPGKLHLDQKIKTLLSFDKVVFNKVVHDFIKTTEYPLSHVNDFSVCHDSNSCTIEDIREILDSSGVGMPAYYNGVNFTVEDDGKTYTGQYARSRSGCYFCFFQQKIEWVWLYEQHPKLFAMAMEYEKDGYSWMDNERLEDLIKPERMKQIKLMLIERIDKLNKQSGSNKLLDILDTGMGESCPSCYI